MLASGFCENKAKELVAEVGLANEAFQRVSQCPEIKDNRALKHSRQVYKLSAVASAECAEAWLGTSSTVNPVDLRELISLTLTLGSLAIHEGHHQPALPGVATTVVVPSESVSKGSLASTITLGAKAKSQAAPPASLGKGAEEEEAAGADDTQAAASADESDDGAGPALSAGTFQTTGNTADVAAAAALEADAAKETSSFSKRICSAHSKERTAIFCVHHFKPKDEMESLTEAVLRVDEDAQLMKMEKQWKRMMRSVTQLLNNLRAAHKDTAKQNKIQITNIYLRADATAAYPFVPLVYSVFFYVSNSAEIKKKPT
jgi:hypothetical protein